MAIVRTAGSEIIRSAHFKLPSAVGPHTLILGKQHHVYTVLSIICQCSYDSPTNANDGLTIGIIGYDALAGTSAQTMHIHEGTDGSITGRDTFVWNDKFSFNGFEPTDFTGPIDSDAKQDAIADQGSSVAQKLFATKGHTNDQWHINVTFIDQNNE
jgi:hypothetical protein